MFFQQSTIASYIRLFEPLVIKALKQYTVSSGLDLQQQVLDLLSQLIQLRVNYCLLDSDQVFIGFIIKQLEFIEEGQIRLVLNNIVDYSNVYKRFFSVGILPWQRYGIENTCSCVLAVKNDSLIKATNKKTHHICIFMTSYQPLILLFKNRPVIGWPCIFDRNSETLIPNIFSFLVMLSYEKTHSKSIIAMPKIIQLCDGIMASGLQPVSHGTVHLFYTQPLPLNHPYSSKFKKICTNKLTNYT